MRPNISNLIQRLEKIKEKYGDIPISTYRMEKGIVTYVQATGVRLEVKHEKTNPKLYIEPYGYE